MLLRKLFHGLSGSTQGKEPRGKKGARAYAVGDVHGCLDLLEQLLSKIEEDLALNPAPEAFLIFVGDLVDRGPDSAGVIERLRRYSHPGLRTIFLAGNHEEYFLRVLSCEQGLLDTWLSYGGKACVESYNLSPDKLMVMPEGDALMRVRQAVPDSHRRFLKSFADTFRFGDYVFVHAGIRPGLALEEQSRADLRWIREPFLDDGADHGFVVVHGHTIVDKVEERSNRIGIDTGAYRSGILTALVIEGSERRVFCTAREHAADTA